MDKIAIVIPTYNNFDLTFKCVDAIKDNTDIPCDIIVVDDGSEKNFVYHKVDQIIRLEENSKYTKAVNAGILACSDKYDYIVLLNNDTLPTKGWLTSMLETMKSNPDCGIVGTKLLVGETKHEATGIMADLLGGCCLVPPKEENSSGGRNAFFNTVQDVACLSFVCVLLKHEMIRKIGLLDESLRMWCSDSDYCLRANQYGYTVKYDPGSVIEHGESKSSKPWDNLPLLRDDQTKFLLKWGGRFSNIVFSCIPLHVKEKIWGTTAFLLVNDQGKPVENGFAKLGLDPNKMGVVEITGGDNNGNS